jgi:hypothetical protein
MPGNERYLFRRLRLRNAVLRPSACSPIDSPQSDEIKGAISTGAISGSVKTNALRKIQLYSTAYCAESEISEEDAPLLRRESFSQATLPDNTIRITQTLIHSKQNQSSARYAVGIRYSEGNA